MCRIWAAESIAFRCGTRRILSSAKASFPSTKTPGRLAPLKRPGNFSFWATPSRFSPSTNSSARFDLIGSAEPVRRLYTIGQLTQILSVKRDVIRHWMRAGLICPVEIVHRLAFFDFVQVQSAKTLCDLTKRGCFGQPHPRLPGAASAMAAGPRPNRLHNSLCLRIAAGCCCVAVTADSWRSPGSCSLTLPLTPTPRRYPPSGTPTADELFDDALELHDSARYAEAASAYLKAIELDPRDPVLYFNLANVHYEQGHLEDSAAAYLAATQHDPAYVEAWNALGCVLSQLGRSKEAIVALRRAVELVPDYGDAHYNLASELESQGESRAAREHWRRYLQLDSTGPWADTAREYLEGHHQDRIARIPS